MELISDLAAIPALAISGEVLIRGIGAFFSIYLALLLVRILLSWFPNVDWSNPILAGISQLTDPYLDIFRSIIPPIGGIDLSAILAIFVVQILQSVITNYGSQLVSYGF
jgi:YggT family protein